jgi:hypothetical protein
MIFFIISDNIAIIVLENVDISFQREYQEQIFMILSRFIRDQRIMFGNLIERRYKGYCKP